MQEAGFILQPHKCRLLLPLRTNPAAGKSSPLICRTRVRRKDDAMKFFCPVQKNFYYTAYLTTMHIRRLEIQLFHFFYGIIAGPCGKRHVSNGRVNTGAGGHAATIGNEHVGHFVHLIEII